MNILADIFRGFWQSLLLSAVPIGLIALIFAAIDPLILIYILLGFGGIVFLFISIVFIALFCFCIKFADGKHEVAGACLFFFCLPALFFAWKWQHNRSMPSGAEMHYYRFVADLVVDGNPLKIDVVVRCGVQIGTPPGGGTSEDVMQTSAYVYAVKVPGGHALKVRTQGNPQESIRPCFGDTTANGRVPHNWLPLVVWYDSADELARGLGYATQDAYQSPRSRLGFNGARIERATAEDFSHFMNSGTKNLVPPHLADSMSHLDAPWLRSPQDITQKHLSRPETAWAFTATPRCRGVYRIPLTEQQRSEKKVLAPNNQSVQELWPIDKPRFWLPDSKEWRVAFSSYVLTEVQTKSFREIYDPRPLDQGGYRPPAVYPVGSALVLEGLASDPTRADPPYYETVIGDGIANRGFIYCDAEAPRPLLEALLKRPLRKQGKDGATRCMADGMLLPQAFVPCGVPGVYAFESDEYVLVLASGSQG